MIGMQVGKNMGGKREKVNVTLVTGKVHFKCPLYMPSEGQVWQV